MDVIVVQAAFPHIFDRQVIRKALILDIGVCIIGKSEEEGDCSDS